MRRHDPDYLSLAAGMLFTAIGLVLMISALTHTTIDGRWLAPMILIGLGAGGVAASLAATRRQRLAADAREGAADENSREIDSDLSA